MRAIYFALLILLCSLLPVVVIAIFSMLEGGASDTESMFSGGGPLDEALVYLILIWPRLFIFYFILGIASIFIITRFKPKLYVLYVISFCYFFLILFISYRFNSSTYFIERAVQGLILAFCATPLFLFLKKDAKAL